MANRDCETCKFRSFKPDDLSDCGHHFECEFYEKNPDIMDDEQCVNYLESICKMFVRGCKNCEGQALEYQQKYIQALRYAIGKMQSSKD